MVAQCDVVSASAAAQLAPVTGISRCLSSSSESKVVCSIDEASSKSQCAWQRASCVILLALCIVNAQEYRTLHVQMPHRLCKAMAAVLTAKFAQFGTAMPKSTSCANATHYKRPCVSCG